MRNREKIKEIMERSEKEMGMNGFDFSILMQNLLVSENGYVIDIGDWECANKAIAFRLLEKIKKHPIIWKLFFMVA